MAYTVAHNRSDESGGFKLYCRGDVRLYLGVEDCTPRPKKGRALLAILAAEQRPLSRTKIIDLLWSDRQEEQARASLRTLLADLKEQFTSRFEDLLVVDRERVGLGPGICTDLTDATLARPAGELFEGLDHIDPELDEWLRIERERWSTQTAAVVKNPRAEAVSPHGGVPQWALMAMLSIALVAGALLYLRAWPEPEQPVVAVLKFKDLTGKNALLTDGLAEELRIQLAQHPRIQVIGRESAEAPSITKDPNQVQNLLGARFTVEGSILNRDGSAYLNVRLIEAWSGKLLWSQVVPAEGAWIRSGSTAIAARLAGNINETVGQGTGSAFAADARAYEVVFAGRRAIRDSDVAQTLRVRAALADVVSQHPRFAPALAALAEATIYSSDHPFMRGPLPLRQARQEAARLARRSIAAAPEFGPAHAALGMAYFETQAAVAPLRRAVELSPGSYEAQHRLARALELDGDYEGALSHQRAAATLQPLDESANYMLLRMLRLTGHSDEVPFLIKNFVRRTDDRVRQLEFLVGAALETGDLSKGVIADRAWLSNQPENAQARRLMMWLKIFLGDRKGALSETSSPDSISAIILDDDLGALLKKVSGLGRDFWSLDWETFDASEYLYSHGRTDVLLTLYDQARAESGGEQPTSYAISPTLILALREAGRKPEADRLQRERAAITERLARSVRPVVVALPRSEILFLRGRDREALELLELAQRDDWWNLQPTVTRLEDRAIYRRVRKHPRFRAIMRDHYANIDRERRELAAELKRLGNGPMDPERLIAANPS